MAAAVVTPVSPQIVGNAFVQQYYHILHHSPSLVHRFYQDVSKLGRPEDDGSMSITTTMTAINEKILSLNYGEFRAEIKSVDAQDSFNMGVHVLVTGYLTGKDNMVRDFAQSFFLAPQERGGYFVLNDMFRYLEKANQTSANQVPLTEIEVPVSIPVPVEQEVAPLQDNHITEQTNDLSVETNGHITEQTNGLSVETNGEVHIIPQNGEIESVEEEPVAEVVDEVPVDDVVQNLPNNSKVVAESDITSEEVPKKSYASIVKDLKERGLSFSSPAPALRKTPPKGREQQVLASSNTEASASKLDAAEIVNNQEVEADSYSIYIKGLPYNATPDLLEDEFKKFGKIKTGGIQVRSKQGFCFGFVEFEEANAVQKAIEASPIPLGGRQAIVEEKKSTNSGGNNRGRFTAGRAHGFRNESGYTNEGMRGRGNYGGGRGHSRAESNGKTEFSNRGNYRGGSTNRGNSQRAENSGANGGRVNRANNMTGSGSVKNVAPRVSATA